MDSGINTGPLDSHSDLWRNPQVWKTSVEPKIANSGDKMRNRYLLISLFMIAVFIVLIVANPFWREMVSA